MYEANPLFMKMGLSGPFQSLDVLDFKITLKIALQASHTVRQAILALLLDGYTGVQIDRNFIPSVYAGCRTSTGHCGARPL